ncbi:MAG: tripartite tricarboxylate transporter substrate binding protein [Gammaproteobacteria bacterium]|nr:tripartite tricarboxylate transporter substrate binding protein [Gammaproteobacteria bacterium]MBU1442160.1 tripartite tricarboxylate transporter substrate binding protein [Gammaproteobacteria bacterium]MBU2288429.1 tripartite tricarboxylate transporter substrate binding protein [Gammaproteobacteria bacterium]MBU2408216.1 tripartite tricarboxylate transporter substrate binding protein [Gammaproteobacteria bacterium]
MKTTDSFAALTRRIAARFAFALAAASALCAFGGTAQAAYPEQPVKLVVGFPPGGGGDLYGRTIANALARHLGQAVIVDNKAGAGGNIAAELVARAKPDGYTLILAMSGNMGSAPAIRSNLPYKVPDDFVPIAQLVETPFGLMVPSDSPIATIKDYVAAAKGGKLTYASTGTGGASQIVMEMVKQDAKLDILHIPYKGSGPALNDLFGGQVSSFFAPYTPLMGQITGGKLRLLAVSSDKRVPSLPNVPTLKESGIDVVMTQWYGLAAPADTPKAVIDTLTRAVRESMKDADLLKIYRADGAQEGTLTGTQFRDFIVKDIANYKRAVDRGNLKAE